MERSTYKIINVVIPVYNEGENIISTLSEMKQKIRTPYKIYIVYDFDDDNTLPVVKDYMQRDTNIRLLKNDLGAGVTNAIKTGFEAVKDGVILVVMADMSDDLGKVDEMFEKINEGNDVVCGSRYMKGGKQIGGPWFKKLLSRIAGVSLYYLIGVPTHDITNSFKMYTKRIFNDITIESNGGFELGMEIVLKAFIKGYKITEVSSVWCDRTAGRSRFRLWKWLPKYLRWYWFGIKGRILKALALLI
jgi:glycosyltransferase involved in cell wall biosynthesis